MRTCRRINPSVSFSGSHVGRSFRGKGHREIQNSIPSVVGMLMAVRNDAQFRHAFARVHQIGLLPKADRPGVESRPKRKHRKRVTKFVTSDVELQAIDRASPDDFSIVVEERHPVMPVTNRRVDLQCKFDRNRPERFQFVLVVRLRPVDFPSFSDSAIKLSFSAIVALCRRSPLDIADSYALTTSCAAPTMRISPPSTHTTRSQSLRI